MKMLVVRESSGVGVNLTWLILRNPSLSPPLSSSLPPPPFSPALAALSRGKETEKNREPGERTASSAPENTAGSFAAVGRIRFFFLAGRRSFRSGFNFHSQRKSCAAVSLSLSLSLFFSFSLLFFRNYSRSLTLSS